MSFGGYLTVCRELKEAGIDLHKNSSVLCYGHTHDRVVEAVKNGEVDVGMVRSDTLEHLANEGKIRLDEFHVIRLPGEHPHSVNLPILHSTRYYPEWPLAKLQHVSETLSKKVAVALLTLPPDSPAALAAHCHGWTVPLNYQTIHDCLKILRFGPYKAAGVFSFQDVFKRYWHVPMFGVIFLLVAFAVAVYVSRINRRLQYAIDVQNHEITERKLVESTLHQSEVKLRNIVETSSDWIWEMNEKGVYTYISPRVHEILGYTPEEMLGKTPFDYMMPEEDERVSGLFGTIAASQKAFKFLENTHLHKDGHPVFLETSGSPLFDQNGKHYGYHGIDRDVTERKQKEAKLLNATTQIEQLFSANPLILISMDENGRIRHWNPAAEKLLSIPASQAIGQIFTQCAIPWEWTHVLKNFRDILLRDKPIQISNIHFKHPDKIDGILNILITLIPTDTPDTSKYLLVGTDITERALLETQLLQAQKLESIGQLSAGIAHELNTPIQYVGDNLRFLQDSFGYLFRLLEEVRHCIDSSKNKSLSSEQITKIRQIAEDIDLEYLLKEMPSAILQSLEGVERTSSIVRAMKGFSHPDSSQDMTPTDINQGIMNTVTVARAEWKYVAELETHLDPQLPLVSCLPGEINQVILNIIINAAHAIAEVVGEQPEVKGKITIATLSNNDHAEILISNTGKDIPPEIQHKLFDPFFTTKKVGLGTGQGLAISHSIIVEKHKGAIRFETGSGKGTTFMIQLPLKT